MKKNILFFLLTFTALSTALAQVAPVMTSIQGQSTVCSTPASAKTFTANAINSPTTYSWSVSPSAGVVFNNPTGSVTTILFPNTNSTYTVYCYASNSAGSSAPVAITVTVFETPTVTFSGATIFCQGSGTNLSASPTIISASSTLSYNWSPATGLSSTTQGTVIANPPVTTNYSVLLTIGSCTNIAPVTVTVVGNPVVSAVANPSVICQGGNSNISMSGSAFSYSLNSVPVSQSATVSPTSSTTYTVGGTGNNGCKTFTQVSVTVIYPQPINYVTTDSILCLGQSVTLNLSGSSSYSLNSNPVGASSTLSPLSTSIYTANAVSPNGCLSAIQFTIFVNANPTLSAVSSRTFMCKGEKATITITGNATTYSANAAPVTPAFTINPTSTKVYTIVGVDANGCTGTISFTQTVNNCIGISEIEHESGLLIYPNPNSGNFIMHSKESGSVLILNELGKEITAFEIKQGQNTEVNDLSPGIYFIINGSKTQKIIVTH